MKKIIVLALSVLAFAAVASAQPRALGVRLGGDAEVSYQHNLGSQFLEADLGMAVGGHFAGFHLTGVYDFTFASVDNFNFYAGPGAQVSMYTADEHSGLGIGIGGQIGAEYQFGTIPFTISLDWRPMWDFLGAGASWSSAALGFRYRF